MPKGSRKQRAMRMLEHAVRLSLRNAETSMSDMANGRLASDLSKDVRRLKCLVQDDPEDSFWDVLHKAIFKLVKFVRQTRC
jgi:hypothetical protein